MPLFFKKHDNVAFLKIIKMYVLDYKISDFIRYFFNIEKHDTSPNVVKCRVFNDGGGGKARTYDLMHVKHAL